jgi:DNA polymerase-1
MRRNHTRIRGQLLYHGQPGLDPRRWRAAINTPLQGTAADLIKLAMIRIDTEITRRILRSRMTLQIHDELLFDVLPAEAEELHALVKQEMEHVATFTVPILAELALGPNWRDIK